MASTSPKARLKSRRTLLQQEAAQLGTDIQGTVIFTQAQIQEQLRAGIRWPQIQALQTHLLAGRSPGSATNLGFDTSRKLALEKQLKDVNAELGKFRRISDRRAGLVPGLERRRTVLGDVSDDEAVPVRTVLGG